MIGFVTPGERLRYTLSVASRIGLGKFQAELCFLGGHFEIAEADVKPGSLLKATLTRPGSNELRNIVRFEGEIKGAKPKGYVVGSVVATLALGQPTGAVSTGVTFGSLWIASSTGQMLENARPVNDGSVLCLSAENLPAVALWELDITRA